MMSAVRRSCIIVSKGTAFLSLTRNTSADLPAATAARSMRAIQAAVCAKRFIEPPSFGAGQGDVSPGRSLGDLNEGDPGDGSLSGVVGVVHDRDTGAVRRLLLERLSIVIQDVDL